MVLCKFFQQGSCRFGSKCNNEHFDVKQVVKTDVEGAVNGKQWPLSSYGPFKDKPSIPNFIEDQSFEEIRLLCYEAKQKNFFDRFHQQFTKEALEASNKMKALLQMTPDIIDVVINVYDIPIDTSCNGVSVAGKPNGNSNNPFGVANAGASSAGSIFAKPAAQPASNIFGNTTAVGGNFASSNASSIFGGGANATQASTNIFGNSSTFGQQSQQQQQQQQQTSIFGQAAKPANSLFGGGNTNTNTQQQSSMFGQQPTQQAAPTMGGNLFAQPAQQLQQSNPGFGLFSQPTQQQPQQTQQQQSSIFAQQPQQQTTNIFGQTQIPQAGNPFIQAAQQPAPTQQGLFAQAAQSMQQPQPPQQGLFAQAAQQTMPQQIATAGQGVFAQVAQPSQNIFGQAMQQQQPQQQQQQQNPANIFQQTSQNSGQQQQAQPPNAGLFQQNTLQNQNPAGNNNPSSLVSSTLYSRMEDLSAEEIEAFKADCFLPGKIPFNPPPRELIY